MKKPEMVNGGILVRADNPKPHECNLPDSEIYGIQPGDMWTCGECKSVHVVVSQPRTMLGEAYSYWNKVWNP